MRFYESIGSSKDSSPLGKFPFHLINPYTSVDKPISKTVKEVIILIISEISSEDTLDRVLLYCNGVNARAIPRRVYNTNGSKK